MINQNFSVSKGYDIRPVRKVSSGFTDTILKSNCMKSFLIHHHCASAVRVWRALMHTSFWSTIFQWYSTIFNYHVDTDPETALVGFSTGLEKTERNTRTAV